MLKPSDRRTQMLKLSTLKSSDAKALRSKISDVKAFTSHLLKPSGLRCQSPQIEYHLSCSDAKALELRSQPSHI